MTKPTVTFYNRVYPPQIGATGRVLYDLAQEMVRDGWNVTVVCAGDTKQVRHEKGVRVVQVKAPVKTKSLFSYLRCWLKMTARGLSLPRADLVVTMTDPPLTVIAGDIIARRHGTSHIHWCHDLFPDLMPALGLKLPGFLMKGLSRWGRRAMKRCDRIIAVGRCMAEYLSDAGIDKSQLSVVTNWPNPELLYISGIEGAKGQKKKRTRARDDVASAVKTAEDIQRKLSHYRPFEKQKREKLDAKFRVLYAGNLGLAHPVETILEAAALLADDYPEIEFMFVGQGHSYDHIAQERGRRGLDNVRLLPWQPEHKLRALMESGDLHLVSMSEDAAGLLVPCKFYSALAVGRPCLFIGPEAAEVAKVVRDFDAGEVIPQGDAEALATAIKTYRLDGTTWFTAQEGAMRAGEVFVPHHSINAWIKRARGVVQEAKDKEFAA